GQLIADYIVEQSAGLGDTRYPPPKLVIDGAQGGSSFNEVIEEVSTRPTIIEVWQKRTRAHSAKSSSSSSSRSGSRPGLDLDKFRNEILDAIRRISHHQPVGPGRESIKYHWTGHDGETQTEIHGNEIAWRTYQREKGTQSEGGTSTPGPIQTGGVVGGGGEVKVIVQPIQPVFYMPRGPQQQPGPSGVSSGGAPNVVYVPRNVYVPVIKPVFVPRERVIVRPQIIHVARPVLVDRPVPVTQRPIIIDRERPVPVPIRAAAKVQCGPQVVREEYVYRDNLPVAYGGRCANYAGGLSYGYMPTHVDNQYATSNEAVYQTQSAPPTVIDMVIPNQFQQQQYPQSHSASSVEQQFHRSGSGLNLPHCESFGPDPIGPRPPQIEVLDTAVNPFWQKTDPPNLLRRYGRPAFDIVDKTNQVQGLQMYSNGDGGVGIHRSNSAASHVSGLQRNGSFGSIPMGDIRNLPPEGFGPGPIPVRINY
ncbi:unnamed protein product, partial [Didymodactylos carnosus]